jgi:hypothetical protein
MSVRLMPRLKTQVLCPVNADRVVAAYAVPSGGIVSNLSVDMDIIAEPMSVLRTTYYNVFGYLVPVLDPAGSVTPDVMWDRQVPKNTTSSGMELDFDPNGLHTQPVYEPGNLNLNRLLAVMEAPVEFVNMEGTLSFARSQGGYNRATDDWVPTDRWTWGSNRRMAVNVPSMLLMAVSQPALTTTSAAYFRPLTDEHWVQLKYLEYVLQQALMHIVGLTEAGAESPWVESAGFLYLMLDSVMEETAGRFAGETLTVFTRSSISLTVTGTLEAKTLSSR